MGQQWSLEQIERLEAMEAEYPHGFLCLFPIAKDFGRSIKWDLRIYKKGLAGVLKPTVEGLTAIGCLNPEEVLEKAKSALSAVQEAYPALPVAEIERLKERVEKKALKVGESK